MIEPTKINVCPHCKYEHDIADILAAARNKPTQARCHKCDAVFNIGKVSDEERFFSLWLVEAEANGLVEDWIYQPESYNLIPTQEVEVVKQSKNKTNVVRKTLYQPHKYTADYKILLTSLGLNSFRKIFPKTYLSGSVDEDIKYNVIVIDIKGGFMNRGAGQEFSINRKLMHYFHDIVVEKAVPWKSQRDRKGEPKKTNKDGAMKPVKCFFMDTFCPKALRTLQNGKVSAMGFDCPTVEEFINKTRSN